MSAIVDTLSFVYVVCLLGQCWVTASSLETTTSPSFDNDCSQLLHQPLHSPDSCSNGSLACSDMHTDSCPPGFLCKEGYCECEPYTNLIQCIGLNSLVITGYCVTYDDDGGIISIGNCPYIVYSYRSGNTTTSHVLYYPLPDDVHKLTNFSCGPFNRTGILCGKCLPEHYPLAYSLYLNCIPCPHVHWNWFRYIMAAYLPLTLFYFIILFFKINTTSSNLFAVVYCCQGMAVPYLLRTISLYLQQNDNSFFVTGIKIVMSLYGIWNLDFFKPFYSDLCLGLDVLPTLALDYAVALYPLLLIIITYILVFLHDRNYRVIIIMCKPFQLLLSLFKKNWSIKTSPIDAFATFFFLSNFKFLSISCDLLVPVKDYHLYQDNYTLRLMYSADVEYFGKEHLPYAVLAIAFLLVFYIFPVVILALYPFQLFQKMMNVLPFRWYILHTFVDAFQGYYKDGTEPGTCDCRWFASFFFITRCCQFIVYVLVNNNLNLPLILMIFVFMSTVVIVLQPFKSSVAHYNVINAVYLQLVTFFGMIVIGVDFGVMLSPENVPFLEGLAAMVSIIPLLYTLALGFYWIYKHKKSDLGIVQRLRAWRRGYDPFEAEQLPDRLQNPSAYQDNQG